MFDAPAGGLMGRGGLHLPPGVVQGGGGIVGGAEAEPGEFPHLVAVLRGGPGGALMCGGSLVAADRVVTAAHCCDG